MFVQVLLSVVAVLTVRVLWRRWKYDLHKIPSPPGHPLFGHTLDLLRGDGESELNRYIGTGWKALGEPEVMKLNIAGNPFVVVKNVECARNVIMSKTASFPKGVSARDFMTPMVGCDANTKCFAAELGVSPYIKTVRRVYMNGLHSSNLKAATPKIHSVLDKMIEIVEHQRQNGPVEFQNLCVRMTLDAIGVTALDMELGGLDNSRQICKLLIEAGHISLRRAFNPLQRRLYTLLPFLKGAQEESRTLRALTAEWEAVTKEILARPDPPAREEPFWYALKSMTDPDTGRPLGRTELRAELALVALAGMDTTGHQLAFILALLASSRQVVENLTAELEEHGLLGPDFKRVTFEDLGDLEYLSAVVKEGLRLSHISAVSFDRIVPEDMSILGYRMPKGTTVVLPGLRWMCSEAEWGDPEVFRPERWLSGEDMSQKFYFPFSVGPRDCVGQKLAILEIRLAIARLFQKYDLIPTCPAEELLKNSRNGLVVESIKGVWLHVNLRSSSAAL